MDKIEDSLELCKEVAEGLRIMVDFYMGKILLYETERAHHDSFMKSSAASRLLNKKSDGGPEEASSSTPTTGKRKPIKIALRRPSALSKPAKDSPSITKSGGETSGRSTPSSSATSATTNTAANKLLSEIQQWKMLRGAKIDEPLPSLMFGPVHLVRLFVKLPVILGKMGMPPKTR